MRLLHKAREPAAALVCTPRPLLQARGSRLGRCRLGHDGGLPSPHLGAPLHHLATCTRLRGVQRGALQITGQRADGGLLPFSQTGKAESVQADKDLGAG